MSALRETLAARRPGGMLLRVQLLDGILKWRPFVSWDHLTLCRQFGLDEHRVYFDLPSTARGVGSSTSGAGGSSRRGKIDGYVMERGRATPIGTIAIAEDAERFRDHDPTDERDMLRLG